VPMRQSHYLTDHATTDDLLHYEDFQAVLYSVVTKAETPLTIGVFGPWGSGKTSLMRMVRQQLEQEKLDSRRTVWFTAWKYDRQDALWRSFILRVLDALYPRETEPKDVPREERPILQNPTDPNQKRRIELLNRLEESIYQAVDWEEIGPRAVNWWQFISNTGKAGVETAAHLSSAGLTTSLKKMLGGDDTPVEEIQKAAAAISHRTKSYNRRQLRHMEEFEAILKEVIALLPKGPGHLIVFVDDLDRCLPEKAIEAINLFIGPTLFLRAKFLLTSLCIRPIPLNQYIEPDYRLQKLRESTLIRLQKLRPCTAADQQDTAHAGNHLIYALGVGGQVGLIGNVKTHDSQVGRVAPFHQNLIGGRHAVILDDDNGFSRNAHLL
jgi:hypothetical protein